MGRPRIRKGEGPRVDVLLDECSGRGALELAQSINATIPQAIRVLFGLYYTDSAVRDAVRYGLRREFAAFAQHDPLVTEASPSVRAHDSKEAILRAKLVDAAKNRGKANS